MIDWLYRLTCYDRLIVWLDNEHCLMIKTTWWKRLDEKDLIRETWWWERFDDEDDLMMRTIWWWERLDDKNDLMMKTTCWWIRLAVNENNTVYLSTLNWVDKKFFLIFLYIANLEQTWQNSSNINSRIELRALISSIRSNINPRIEFELLSETRFYDQTIFEAFRDFVTNVSFARIARSDWASMFSIRQSFSSIYRKMSLSQFVWNFWLIQIVLHDLVLM